MDSVNNPNFAPLQNGQVKGTELNPPFSDLNDPKTLKNHVIEISQSGSLSISDRLRKAEIKVTDQIEKPPIAWKQESEDENPAILGTLGNFSMIIGKAKSRKSFFINIAISAVLSKDRLLNQFKGELPEDKRKVLYFDTEQGKHHVQQALNRICKQIDIEVPKDLQVFGLRKENPKNRLDIIDYAIRNTEGIGFVVIDGIRDLINSINDEEEATKVSSKLLEWTEVYGIHIIVVLHQNKGDNNARGHLGSELQNKAETVLSVSKDQQNEDISIVEPQFCRNKEPQPFAFEIIDDLPVLVDNYEFTRNPGRKALNFSEWPDQEICAWISDIFSKVDQIGYGNLREQLKQQAIAANKPIGDNKSKDLISYCKERGWIIQERDKAPYKQGVLA